VGLIGDDEVEVVGEPALELIFERQRLNGGDDDLGVPQSVVLVDDSLSSPSPAAW